MTLASTITELSRPFSIEVTPKEARHIRRFTEDLRPGTAVYVTYLPKTPFAATIETVRRIAADGMRPVPHLAVRAIRDAAHLDEQLAALTGEGGVDEVLLIAGSLPRPAGDFDATIQALRTGVLEQRGIRRVGVAGHPEGSPDISDDGLRQALKEKNEFAVDSEMELYLITQFCFTADPVVAWERQIRAEGNLLPVHVGLPGLASPATLVKFGLSCGVGPSLNMLRTQRSNVLRMTSLVHYPHETIVGVARAAAEDSETLLRRFHFFPFGSYVRTAAWARSLSDGRFTLDPATDAVEVHR